MKISRHSLTRFRNGRHLQAATQRRKCCRASIGGMTRQIAVGWFRPLVGLILLGTVLTLSPRPSRAEESPVFETSVSSDDAGAPNAADFVLVEGGTFRMGSHGEVSDSWNEQQHMVTLTYDFYLQRHELTQGQWQSLMGTNPSEHSDCGVDCPVESVSWFAAVRYANTLSLEHGLAECYSLSDCQSGGDLNCGYVEFSGLDCTGYRLPTEAEWEYSARAGTTTPWPCGHTASCLDDIAWHKGNAQNETQPVGTRESNAWGLHDMFGNVDEMLWDFYAPYDDGSPWLWVADPVGPPSGSLRVMRGASVGHNDSEVFRSACRANVRPKERWQFVGFRLARTAFQP